MERSPGAFGRLSRCDRVTEGRMRRIGRHPCNMAFEASQGRMFRHAAHRLGEAFEGNQSLDSWPKLTKASPNILVR